MDNINKQLNSALTTLQQAGSGQTSQQHAPPEAKLIELIWGLMSSMYGHKWVSSYGDQVDPDKVWAACLKGISREQINYGLNQCAIRGLEWPPSAPEFRAMCTDDEAREWRAFRARAAETDKMLADNRLRLSDQGAKDRAKKARDEAMGKLGGMFKGTAAGMVATEQTK